VVVDFENQSVHVDAAMNATPMIEKAIRLRGSEAKLGKACNVSQGAIWKAKRAGRVSAELALAIEVATEGQVTRWELRPDLWPAPNSEIPEPCRAGGVMPASSLTAGSDCPRSGPALSREVV
jgi:DNA-binding transcriptional regulator YdaS (Cro superfamily)